ncbi:hypothetical protein MMC26_002963 [Xylographa opegraphella]|nr:hypothetical protein [Xylographa opegraphella]
MANEKPPYTSNFDLAPWNWRVRIAMTKKAEGEEGKRNILREENTADGGGQVSKCIPHASDDEILKGRGSLHKRLDTLLTLEALKLTEEWHHAHSTKY